MKSLCNFLPGTLNCNFIWYMFDRPFLSSIAVISLLLIWKLWGFEANSSSGFIFFDLPCRSDAISSNSCSSFRLEPQPPMNKLDQDAEVATSLGCRIKTPISLSVVKYRSYTMSKVWPLTSWMVPKISSGICRLVNEFYPGIFLYSFLSVISKSMIYLIESICNPRYFKKWRHWKRQ